VRKLRADAGNWQTRGQEFQVGQNVQLMNGAPTDQGRVVAVYPAIGMIDVQFPHTSQRFPVEDVQIMNPGEDPFITPRFETVPGGAGTESFNSDGPAPLRPVDKILPLIEKVHEVPRIPPSEVFSRMASDVSIAYLYKKAFFVQTNPVGPEAPSTPNKSTLNKGGH